jgi:HEXXH motif-containing protein
VTDRHRLVAPSFDAIAAGHADPAGLSVLQGGQLSKHLLMLRMIADEVGSKPGRWVTQSVVSAVRESFELLTEAHRRDPPTAANVLGYPYVGAWLARCVRELRRAQGWPPLAHLTGIAAAAAIRVGLEVDLAVCPANGTVSLPGVGLCRPRGDISPLWVRHHAGRTTVDGVELPDDPSLDRPGWYGLQQLAATMAVPTRVVLDDLDPYRATPVMTVTGRLTRSRHADWRRLFTATWRLLCREHELWATQLADLLVALTPLQEQGGGHGMSATTRQAFGAVALTYPGDAHRLAASLCHELQHTKLNALLELVNLCEPADERLYYAPWRADPRPLPALLHGTYAFLGVADFWQRRMAVDDNPRAQYEFARARLQVRQALDVLLTADGFTTAGRRFVTGMATRIDEFAAGQLPEREHHYAELATEDHHVTWRIRNLKPDPEAVQTVADAWQAGRFAPVVPAPSLAPQPERFVQSSRAGLLATVAADRSVRHLAAADASPQLTAVRDGDVHLIEGRYDHAAACYRTALSDDGASTAAWTGLSLARQHAADSGEATIWRTHPELVHALYRALVARSSNPPSPEQLATWLATADPNGLAL